MTLDEVAGAADLTKSFLGDIERDKTSPSVASLVRLCEVLALPVGDLFTPARSGVVRANDRPPIRFGGTGVSDYLISPAEAKRLQVIFSDIEPGGTGGEKLYTLACEEEFVFVLEGAIRAGGSTIRDYARPDGELGYFAREWRVYGREGEPCGCGGLVERRVDSGRSTFWCPKCQS